LVASHTFRGVLHSPDFACGKQMRSLSGATFTLQCSEKGTWQIGGSNFLFTDILTKNGVVHVVDKMLGSQQTQQAEEQPQQPDQESEEQYEDEGEDQQGVITGRMEEVEQGDQQQQLGGISELSSVHHRLQARGGLRRRALTKMLVSWSLGEQLRHHLGQSAMLKGLKKNQSARGALGFGLKKQSVGHDHHAKLTGLSQQQFGMDDDDDSQLQQQQQRGGQGGRDRRQRRSSEAHCMFHSSSVCKITDTLATSQTWLRLKQQKQQLQDQQQQQQGQQQQSPSAGGAAALFFAASNEPSDISCVTQLANPFTSNRRKDYSNAAMSAPVVNVCYSPRVWNCRQGKLLLKSALDNLRDLQQQGQGQQQQEQEGDEQWEFGSNLQSDSVQQSQMKERQWQQ
jgi:hypothetical protein